MAMLDAGLRRSRWAPSLYVHSSSFTTVQKPTAASRSDDLRKLQRLIDRLSWKSYLLQVSQQRAIEADASNDSSLSSASLTMFKLDFYEYYVLLERILVQLLAFVGIFVSRGGSTDLGGRAHRYHANVLEALDKETNPLHKVLGKDPVRRYLGIAKDFRNRWKDADETEHLAAFDEKEGILGPHLDLLLGKLLQALIESLELVKKMDGLTANSDKPMNNDSREEPKQDTFLDSDMEEAPWEAVGDAMEWEES